MLSAELPSSEKPGPPLRVTDLTKRYGTEHVVDRVTFSASRAK